MIVIVVGNQRQIVVCIIHLKLLISNVNGDDYVRVCEYCGDRFKKEGYLTIYREEPDCGYLIFFHTIVCHLSFVICHLSFVICHLSFIFYNPVLLYFLFYIYHVIELRPIIH